MKSISIPENTKICLSRCMPELLISEIRECHSVTMCHYALLPRSNTLCKILSGE